MNEKKDGERCTILLAYREIGGVAWRRRDEIFNAK